MQILTRAQARAAGAVRYFTGKPCVHGHVAERFTSVGTCCACSRKRYAEWRAAGKASNWRKANRERILAQQQAYRDAAAEQRAAHMRSHYAVNREEKLAYQKRYLLENRAAVYARLHKRRARKLCATPPWFGELDDFVLLEAAQLCTDRQRATGVAWHIDHMVPLQARRACGLHYYGNIQVIPSTLNVRKGNKLIMMEPGAWIRCLDIAVT